MSGHNHPSNPEWHPAKFLAVDLTACSGLAETAEGVAQVFSLDFTDVDGNHVEIMFEPELSRYVIRAMLQCQWGAITKSLEIAQRRREWNEREK